MAIKKKNSKKITQSKYKSKLKIIETKCDFEYYYKKFLPSILERENYSDHHLKNLEILCSLYVDYDKLTEEISNIGYSYEAEGRYGTQRKTIPEVTERNNIISQIYKFSKLLDIVPDKDKGSSNNDDMGEWN